MKALDAAQTEARGTLLALLAIAIVLQPAAIGLGRQTLANLGGGADTFGQWDAYLSRPIAPDVLFVGDSRVRADIDAAGIAALLSRPEQAVRVFKLGISSGQPAFLSALTYRVLERPTRPRILIYGLSEFQFNDGSTWDATADYWAISEPPTVSHVARSIARSTDPGRLLRGWVVPVLANDRLLWRGADCWWARLRVSTACSEQDAFATQVMTGADEATVLTAYRQDLRDYRYSSSQEQYLIELITAARAQNVTVALLIPPVWRIDELYPARYLDYLTRMQTLARDHNVGLLDLHTAMRDQPNLWADPSHLNVVGAQALAPMLLPLLTGDGGAPAKP